MSEKNKSSIFSTIGKGIKSISIAISNLIDRLLYSRRFLALVSLLIALLIFASVLYSEQMANQITQSTELTAPVEVVGDLEEYEISNVPSTVQVLVTGSAVDVRSAQNQNNHSAVLDISTLGEGNHRIRLDRKGFSPTVKVIFQPEFVDVNVSRKVSAEYDVEPTYINMNKLEPQYILSNLTLDNTQVTINTSQEKLSQISQVRALIDVSNKTESFSSVAHVVAYDQQGKAMDVEIEPNELNATVTIASPSRQVPIAVRTEGQIPNNKSVEAITLDQPSITIYGPEEILNTISSIPVVINAQTLTQDETVLKHTLVRPEGVRSMEFETVNISITLGDKETSQIEKSQIFFENNANNYEVVRADGSEMVVDVTMSGTADRLAQIDPSSIKVFIDMSALRVGQQSVTLKVSGPDPLVDYQVTHNQIDVIISEKGE